jgi:hypothetical protein
MRPKAGVCAKRGTSHEGNFHKQKNATPHGYRVKAKAVFLRRKKNRVMCCHAQLMTIPCVDVGMTSTCFAACQRHAGCMQFIHILYRSTFLKVLTTLSRDGQSRRNHEVDAMPIHKNAVRKYQNKKP